ncbi:hypothetical protein VNI00_016493 [Paramarasmius palmivorus]|uniref:Uncharacterized protein n=1 Tax=Paramarasmius palmivorus TaxID=297713 RepID=A0AAW0BCT3_9AGAR
MSKLFKKVRSNKVYRDRVFIPQDFEVIPAREIKGVGQGRSQVVHRSPGKGRSAWTAGDNWSSWRTREESVFLDDVLPGSSTLDTLSQSNEDDNPLPDDNSSTYDDTSGDNLTDSSGWVTDEDLASSTDGGWEEEGSMKSEEGHAKTGRKGNQKARHRHRQPASSTGGEVGKKKRKRKTWRAVSYFCYQR